MSKPISRISGFYKVHKYVNIKGGINFEPIIAEWSYREQCWYICGVYDIFYDDYFYSINEKRIIIK